MNQQHYRVVISYNGSDYFGWQDLGDGGEKPTVQFEVLQALRKISKYAQCVVAGASRTDAGVHALGQVAKFSTPLQIDPTMLQLGMNSLLPDTIRIRECVTCTPDFNPNKQCVSKTYRYYFSIDEIGSPLLRDIVAHVPLVSANGNANLDDALHGIERMKVACAAFIGQHDFCDFSASDGSEKSTVRTLLKLDLQKSDSAEFGGEIYSIEITGNGFLRHMVRYIVAALFEVGREKITVGVIEEAFVNPGQGKLSSKAKSRGLHLVTIDY